MAQLSSFQKNFNFQIFPAIENIDNWCSIRYSKVYYILTDEQKISEPIPGCRNLNDGHLDSKMYCSR